jgi:hypothetical protein
MSSASSFALERGPEISAPLLPSPLKKPKSTAMLLAGLMGLIMHLVMSALAFSFLFAVLLGLT